MRGGLCKTLNCEAIHKKMNGKIATIFLEMAALLEMEEVAFKPRAYTHAADSLLSLNEDVGDIYKKDGTKALLSIPGIGAGIAEKIEEFIETGKIKEYEHMKKKFPVDISSLMKVDGLGPKTIQKLYRISKSKM